jgi:hypothetical protein
MPFDVGDWVRTDQNEVVKVVAIDAELATATVYTLDSDRLRVVPATYAIEKLTKFEIER